MRPDFFRYYRRSRRPLVRLLVLGGVVVVLTVVLIAAVQMRPLLEGLATTRVSNVVTGIVSESVYEAIEAGTLEYDALVTLEKDNEGKVSAVCSNMAAFNHLQAEILDTVLTRIGQGTVHSHRYADRVQPAGRPWTADPCADGVGGHVPGAF